MKILSKLIGTVVNSVSQTSNKSLAEDFKPAEGIDKICRQAAAESMVLLKNDDVLPIKEDTKVSVFGRVQSDSFYVGYGSGGDVNAHYKISFIDGMKNANIKINKSLLDTYDKWRKKNVVDDGFWGHWPMSYEEMPLDEDTVNKAAKTSDIAIVFIGRAAGEDRENTLTQGSFYLTEEEDNMLKLVSAKFTKWLVVLNVGGIFDFSWTEKYNPSAILFSWLGGMETGNAFADIITGKVNPSGSLTDTIARNYEDYPSAANFGNRKMNTYAEDIFVGYRYFETFNKENVLYPFGLGLSYTDFNISNIKFSSDKNVIRISADITNTGKVNGKKVVQLYMNKSGTLLSEPAKELKGFVKTKELAPGEKQTVKFNISYYDISSYDDNGITGYRNAYVLEKGIYTFELGFSVRDTISAGSFTVDKTKLIQQLTEISSVEKENAFMRLGTNTTSEKTYKTYEPAPIRRASLKDKILASLPDSIPMTVGLHFNLSDVAENKITLNDFVSSLSYTELEAISRGDYVMSSPLGPKGNAGVFGGVLESMRDKGIPPITCTDGPSGIRLAASSALLPCGTALACSWNIDLVKKLYSFLGKEMRERGSDVLLAPGMNIHRNPLCGRNFEYFSEDPFVTGNIAAAVIEGLHESGVSGCPKHFACNNQETNRVRNNAVVSERALREIYLKGFEICVKKAKPLCLMSSYNKINGVWGHYNYDLATTVLRDEWGYQGMVMTDWWMRSSASPEFPILRDQAYRVRSQIDVLMPGGERTGRRVPDGTLLASLGKKEGITTGELQRTASNVIRMILKLQELRKKTDIPNLETTHE